MIPPPRRTLVRYLLCLQEVLQEGGIDISRLAQATGIHESYFTSPDSALTDAELEAYVAATRALTGRTDLGFELGQRIKTNSHGLLGYGLISSTSLHEFVGLMRRQFHQLGETWALRYRRDFCCGELLWVPRTTPNRETLHFVIEAIASSFHNQVQLMMGEKIRSYDIHLSIPKPLHAHRYSALAPARFHFHEGTLPGVRMVIPGAMLDIPLPLGDSEVLREVEELCSVGSPPPRSEVSWSAYVTMMLREASQQQVTLDALAHHIHISARSIDRHLKKEGVSYRELSDKVRFERARQILLTGRSTVMDAAMQLGFSDAANFSRAFKRVVGVSPGEYRQSEAT